MLIDTHMTVKLSPGEPTALFYQNSATGWLPDRETHVFLSTDTKGYDNLHDTSFETIRCLFRRQAIQSAPGEEWLFQFMGENAEYLHCQRIFVPKKRKPRSKPNKKLTVIQEEKREEEDDKDVLLFVSSTSSSSSPAHSLGNDQPLNMFPSVIQHDVFTLDLWSHIDPSAFELFPASNTEHDKCCYPIVERTQGRRLAGASGEPKQDAVSHKDTASDEDDNEQEEEEINLNKSKVIEETKENYIRLDPFCKLFSSAVPSFIISFKDFHFVFKDLNLVVDLVRIIYQYTSLEPDRNLFHAIMGRLPRRSSRIAREPDIIQRSAWPFFRRSVSGIFF